MTEYPLVPSASRQSRLRAQLVCLLGGVLLLSACGTAPGSKGPQSKSLLASLAGTSPGVVINETSGRIGTVTLGEPVTSVKSRLPSRYFFLTQTHGDDLTYCSNPNAASCTGVMLHVFDRCAFGPLCNGAQGKRIGRIDVTAGPAESSAWRSVLTLRGIHLFSPIRDVLAHYKIEDTGAGICGGMPAPSATYVAIAGPNTISFTTYAGRVRVISIKSGYHRACDPKG